MKICYLGNARSIHLQRWIDYSVQLGHEVLVISNEDVSICGVKTFALGSVSINKYIAYVPRIIKVMQILDETRPDVLHAHYVSSYGVLAAFAARLPWVMSAWGSDILGVEQKNPVKMLLNKIAVRRAVVVQSLSDEMSAQLVQLGCETNKLLKLPFGVDPAVFLTREGDAGSSAADRTVDVVTTRPCEEVYDNETLLEALAIMRKAGLVLRCEIYGGGSLEERLRRRAGELGLSGQIDWLGRVSPRRIRSALQRAKVFVSCSLSDGNNISLNEAMACGALPVCSDIAANREWIDHGDSGFLFQSRSPESLARALALALRKSCDAAELKSRNYTRVQQRANADQNMRIMHRLYQRIAVANGLDGQI